MNKKIRVILRETKFVLVGISASILKETESEEKQLTFDEIISLYQNNKKNKIKEGRLFCDNIHQATHYTLSKLKELVLSRDILYKVNLDSSFITFEPIVKTKDDLDKFKKEVIKNGLGL
tara:strand:- start:144 stop:500 length:357 start_codon:yes stop_codon:yes gene_type:complete